MKETAIPSPRKIGSVRDLAAVKLSTRTALVIILGFAFIAFTPFYGIPWGWYPSYGQSYGETMKGITWTHQTTSFKTVSVGDNIVYHNTDGKDVIKRIRFMQKGWVWVMGDNNGDGASTGSYYVGWLKLPWAKKSHGKNRVCLCQCELHPDYKHLSVLAVLDDFFSPFDRRPLREKRIAFNHIPDTYKYSPDNKYVAILEDNERICVYDSSDNLLVEHVAIGYRETGGTPLEWRNGKVVFMPNSEPHMYGIITPATRRSIVFDATTTLPMRFVLKKGSHIIKPGAIATTSTEMTVTCGEQSEENSVPTVSIDGKKVVCTMETTQTVKHFIRNIGMGCVSLRVM